MIVYCSSDWHCPPQGLRQQVKEFIRKAKLDADLIVGNGDLFDLMEYPWREFVECKTVQEFSEELEGKPFVYVAGNHDPAKYIRKVIAIPNVQIMHGQFPLKLGETT
jgi:metallophosphoesterase superfamily enzyme